MRANRHIIVGTAGHIDHGKTRAGARAHRHRHRPPARKRRSAASPSSSASRTSMLGGDRSAFVDVPGHERFVRNMLAGAGGIDLGAAGGRGRRGRSCRRRASTSTSAACSASRAASSRSPSATSRTTRRSSSSRRRSRRSCAGTFLEGARGARLGAQGAGSTRCGRRSRRDREAAGRARGTRLPPADRPRVHDAGFGTVVTGTAWSRARRRRATSVEVAAGGPRARVRGVQVHGETRQAAFAGERVALDSPRPEVRRRRTRHARGDRGALRPQLDARRDARRSSRPWDRPRSRTESELRIHHGAAETLRARHPARP